MANATAIPLNANVIVIAFDVLNHIIKKRKPQMRWSLYTSSIAYNVASYRAHTNMVFKDNLKELCDQLNETQESIVETEFQEIIKNNETVNEECLIDCGRRFRKSLFKEGFTRKNFLVYCIRIAVVSCSFYEHGLSKAADIAVNFIVSTLPDGLNGADFDDVDTERLMDTEESSPSTNQNYSKREPPKLISSETEESSNDSISICESDSILTDNFNQSERSSETESSSSVPYVAVQDLTAEISELTVSNFDQTCDITEQSGISSLSPVALPGSNLSSPVQLPGSDLCSPVPLPGSKLSSSVPYVKVQDLTAGICKLTVSNFDQTCDISEQSGISSLSPVALPGSNLSSPVQLPGSNLSSPVQLSGSNLSSPVQLPGSKLSSPVPLPGSNLSSPVPLPGSNLSSPVPLPGSNLSSPVPLPGSNVLEVPITRSSSVSPRKRSFPKEDTTHLQPKNLSDELAKPTSSPGKRRSTGKDDSVSSNIPELAAEKDETAEEVFAPTESKKPKIEEVDKK